MPKIGKMKDIFGSEKLEKYKQYLEDKSEEKIKS